MTKRKLLLVTLCLVALAVLAMYAGGTGLAWCHTITLAEHSIYMKPAIVMAALGSLFSAIAGFMGFFSAIINCVVNWEAQ